ncbi:cache domain-containing sensor histidine kinase [Saccharococcus caldoxylosilyticus]|uniref:cache domain-containing sensor histidine kinase n=2 Tax=Anoxybacillaceae TaxID=3120669 RepID=UPI001FCB68D3|nr:sensor histidine kinase [Parageobacillus caldoxylosilyticus]BDG36140.1 sensor histidine kinase YesM [Parageobacillus caldoxylosilyticus]BDG39925.1 sensor histidine kinase YesM [Parageobacillus caldoxylosilyticus]
MKGISAFFKKKYVDLKIRYKLFILVSLIIAISFSSTFLALQYTFQVYDGQIYNKSFQLLSTTSNTIENELEKIEDVSYRISTDPQIQRYLSLENAQRTEYEKFIIRHSMIDRILNFTTKERYIQSVSIIDANGIEYNVGSRIFKIQEEQKKRAKDAARKAHGSNIWMNWHAKHPILVSVREIRKYENLSFDHLGIIIIQVNLEKLIENLLEGSKKIDGEFLVMDRNSLIYPEQIRMPFNHLASSLDMGASGYQIKTINHKKYFVVHIKSNSFEWSYLNIVPFSDIFKSILIIKTAIAMIFILLSLAVTSLGIKFSKSITSSLENLLLTIKDVQEGDFKEAKKKFLKTPVDRDDEVGELYRNVQLMVQRIDELITENFLKQLVIKETQFKALQAQINPHFLYNTLESINWLAKANNQTQISRMVESLAFLLRNSMSLKKPLVTIEEELRIVENYILIQKYRFEDRLDFHMSVDPGIFQCSIPRLTLQPLVENSIHYALEPRIEPCKIRIYSILDKGDIKLVVEDDGPGMNPKIIEQIKEGKTKTRGKGIGLANIDERIKLSYGEKYGVHIESDPLKGTKVIVTLPYDREGFHVQRTVSG